MGLEHIQITRITGADLAELQKLGRKTFSEAFSPDNTAENMQRYLDTAFATETLAAEVDNVHSEWYFAILENYPVGYLKVNHAGAQTEVNDPKSLEIERIYVLQQFHGKKVGQLLFDHALQTAMDKKLDYLWLGVWEKNSKAIRFYEKNGFVPFGKHVFRLGDDEQTDILMKRNLAPVKPCSG